MGNNGGLLPIHNFVYSKLIESNKDSFFRRELDNIIINSRIEIKNIINLEKIRKELKKSLGDCGFTEICIDKICKYIDWKARFNLDDCNEIKNTLLDKGYLVKGEDPRKYYLKK